MAAANPEHGQNTEKPHCPICLGQFKTPRQLPCLHSFCLCCLEDYISSKAVKVKELKECECPICRTMVPISRKCKTSKMWASLFPIDSILQSIKGKEKEEVDKLCDCCVSDGISVVDHGFCVVCEEAMCETCQKVHQRQKATMDHSIVTIEELTKSLIFLIAQRMISQVKVYYKQIKEKFVATETVTLNLEVYPQIQCILAQRSDIGRVICRKELGSFPILGQTEMGEVMEIKKTDDKNPCYTGITYLQGDQVMLADYNNNRVLLLDSSYQYISCFTLPDGPYDICVTNHQDVAVSIPGHKTIQFLSITNVTINLTRQVQTRYICYGIAPAGNGKIAVSGLCNQKDKFYWSLITSTGEKKCHQFECQCDPSWTYVALNSSCTRVYITVADANSLYCFDMDGRMMFVYTSDSLNRRAGVATDRDDNVYVVTFQSSNIHQLTSDGTSIRIINKGIPNCLEAICFNNSSDKFVISSFLGNKIYMFLLK